MKIRRTFNARNGLLIAIMLPLLSCPLRAADLPDPAFELLDSVTPLRVEYQADITFRLADAGSLQRGKRLDVALSGLMNLASTAREQFKRSGQHMGLSLEGEQLNAFDKNLDSLSIRLRIISLIARTDPRRARELFDSLSTAYPARGCQDPFAVNLDLYYSVLGNLFVNSFSAAERAKGKHIEFLLDKLQRLPGLAALAPSLSLVAAVPLDDDARERAMQSVLRAFSLPIEPREFTQMLAGRGTVSGDRACAGQGKFLHPWLLGTGLSWTSAARSSVAV